MCETSEKKREREKKRGKKRGKNSYIYILCRRAVWTAKHCSSAQFIDITVKGLRVKVPLWHETVELWKFRSGMGQWSFECSALAWGSGTLNVPLWYGTVELSKFRSSMGQCSTLAYGSDPLRHVAMELWMFHYGMEQWLFQVFQLNAVSMYLCISVECGIYAIGKNPYALHPFSSKLPQHCLWRSSSVGRTGHDSRRLKEEQYCTARGLWYLFWTVCVGIPLCSRDLDLLSRPSYPASLSLSPSPSYPVSLSPSYPTSVSPHPPYPTSPPRPHLLYHLMLENRIHLWYCLRRVSVLVCCECKINACSPSL